MSENVASLLNNGMTLDEIQRFIDDRVPLDEVAAAAKARIDSGKSLVDPEQEPQNEGFVPFVPPSTS